MSDWIVAAAVVDRICFILIAFFFVGGTLAFIIVATLATLAVDSLQYSD